MTLAEALLGGPGLDGYVYNATVYCVDCGKDIIKQVFADVPPTDFESGDSDVLPQPVFFGESDTAQHCDDCGEYLYGPQGEEL